MILKRFISTRFTQYSVYFKVCFSLKGPFKTHIKLHLHHLYAYNDTHDSTRATAVTFTLTRQEGSRITCFDMLYHLQNSNYMLENRKMKTRSFLHVYRIDLFRDESVQHLDFVEDLFIDNLWIGKPDCAEACPVDKPLNDCPGQPCTGLRGMANSFYINFRDKCVNG